MARVVFTRDLVHGSRGKDVWAVQRALSAWHTAAYGSDWTQPKGLVWPNGVWGANTQWRWRQFQRDHGLTETGSLGKPGLALLAPFFDAFGRSLMLKFNVQRAEARRRALEAGRISSVRLAIVTYAWLCYRARANMRYTQAYPGRIIGVVKRVLGVAPASGDCSGWFITTHGAGQRWSATGINPNGYVGWPPYGYTGSLRAFGHKVTKPKPGDAAHYGPGTGRHVALVVRTPGDGLPGTVDRTYVLTFGHYPMGYTNADYRSDRDHYRSCLP